MTDVSATATATDAATEVTATDAATTTGALQRLAARWIRDLSPERLAVSAVVQEAVLKIVEEGVEAAAVTVVPMRPGAAPRQERARHIAFNRPFGVVVLAGSEDTPLFTAWQAEAPVAPIA